MKRRAGGEVRAEAGVLAGAGGGVLAGAGRGVLAGAGGGVRVLHALVSASILLWPDAQH